MVLFQDPSWDFGKIDKWPIPIHKRCKCAIKTQGVAYNFLTSNQEIRGQDLIRDSASNNLGFSQS